MSGRVAAQADVSEQLWRSEVLRVSERSLTSSQLVSARAEREVSRGEPSALSKFVGPNWLAVLCLRTRVSRARVLVDARDSSSAGFTFLSPVK